MIKITNSGCAGIGTSSPKQKLNIRKKNKKGVFVKSNRSRLIITTTGKVGIGTGCAHPPAPLVITK